VVAHRPWSVAVGLLGGGGGTFDGAREGSVLLEAAVRIEILPVEFSTALSVIDTARRHDLSVYDACYLDLADIRGVGLATVDARLSEACRVAGIPLIAA